jgi:hypothetical protein
MLHSTSTLLVIFLLALAASLASYLLRQWAFTSGRHRTFAWAGISLAATLLLAATVVVVLSISFLPQRLFTQDDRATEPMIKPAQSGSAITHSDPAGEASPEQSLRTARNARVESGSDHRRTRDSQVDEKSSDLRDGPEPQAAATSLATDAERRAAADIAARVSNTGVVASADPWGATKCVVPVHLDPANPTRWTIKNDCGAPVGIVLATCMRSAPECNVSKAWQYEEDGMVLPAKYQRSVTEAEQTRTGHQLRHLACTVTTPAAIRLIGLDSETRSSPSWRAEFESVRERDECLNRVKRLSDAGRHAGVLIDDLRANSAVRSASLQILWTSASGRGLRRAP